MSDCNRWLERLLDEGASAEVIKDFRRLYSELMLGITSNEEFSRDEIFDIIKTMGVDDADAVNAKIYLAYVIGKFQASDAYASAIGENITEDSIHDTFIDNVMNDAIKLIKER
jgi:hypothetical protein